MIPDTRHGSSRKFVGVGGVLTAPGRGLGAQPPAGSRAGPFAVG